MTRIRTRNVKSDRQLSRERPESLGRPVVGVPPILPAVPASGRNEHGYGPAAGTPEDAYPQINGAHDAAILRREEARRHEHWADNELF